MYSSKVREHFRKRADEYERYSAWCKDMNLFEYCTEPLKDMIPSIRCLDIGGGTGWIAFQEYKRSGRKWTVLDICPEMGAQVPQGVEFVLGDAHSIPFPERSFGHIMARSVLQYLDAKRVLNECARVISTRGHLVVAQKVYRLPGLEDNKWLKRYWRFRNPLILNQWTVQEQESLIADAGFRVLRTYLYEERRTIPLDVWLSRSGTISKKRQEKLRELIESAPPDVQKVIRFKISNRILSYNRLWAITISRLETVKRGLVPAVVSLIVERFIDGKLHILLQKRKKRYEEPMSYFGCFELPQGKIEIGQNILSQIRRELKQETGLDLQTCKCRIRSSMNSTKLTTEICKPIICTHVFGELNFLSLAFIVTATGEPQSEDVDREHRWVPLCKLYQLLREESFYPLNHPTLERYLEMRK